MCFVCDTMKFSTRCPACGTYMYIPMWHIHVHTNSQCQKCLRAYAHCNHQNNTSLYKTEQTIYYQVEDKKEMLAKCANKTRQEGNEPGLKFEFIFYSSILWLHGDTVHYVYKFNNTKWEVFMLRTYFCHINVIIIKFSEVNLLQCMLSYLFTIYTMHNVSRRTNKQLWICYIHFVI